jgi:hypothetical protein
MARLVNNNDIHVKKSTITLKPKKLDDPIET